jgi:hypothetical protein
MSTAAKACVPLDPSSASACKVNCQHPTRQRRVRLRDAPRVVASVTELLDKRSDLAMGDRTQLQHCVQAGDFTADDLRLIAKLLRGADGAAKE